MECNEATNLFSDKTANYMHPLSYLASQANEDVLCYHQEMKAEDSLSFREAKNSEIQSFKKEGVLELTPINNKTQDRTLTPFVW